MKLLYDQNLSRRLVVALSKEFPDSQHVRDAELDQSPDEEVWRFARANGLAVVSKDTDFMQMSLLRGAPPKVVCIRGGNSSTAEIEDLLRRHVETIRNFGESDSLSLLLLHIRELRVE